MKKERDCCTAKVEAPDRGEVTRACLPASALMRYVQLFPATSFKFLGASSISAPLYVTSFAEKYRHCLRQVHPGD